MEQFRKDWGSVGKFKALMVLGFPVSKQKNNLDQTKPVWCELIFNSVLVKISKFKNLV